MLRVEDGGWRRDRRQVVGRLDLSESPEGKEAACDSNRQAHVDVREQDTCTIHGAWWCLFGDTCVSMCELRVKSRAR